MSALMMMMMRCTKPTRVTNPWRIVSHSSSCSSQAHHFDLVDLTIATTKMLVRLRRDDLVKMCETRDLDVAGTKPQLAEALLQWRDRCSTEFSSPSSAGTVRPPSTGKPRANCRRKSDTPPVLMRTHRFHTDEPRTPPLSLNKKDQDPELELDLESLGLEDREIPPDKLTKLEKIGSGGFKDVFIGKLKGRKIAISEFRGQLSPSMSVLSSREFRSEIFFSGYQGT